jgi:hypothetical protein
VDLEGEFSDRLLDNRVRRVLKHENHEGFDQLMSAKDPIRLDYFHQFVYQDGMLPFDTGLGRIGSDVTERDNIQKTILTFSKEVAAYAKRFCLLYQYGTIDELILTGGGCNIPEVRDAVVTELSPMLAGKAHVRALDGENLPANCTALSRTMVRGATAIGAASVIFDYPTSIA